MGRTAWRTTRGGAHGLRHAPRGAPCQPGASPLSVLARAHPRTASSRLASGALRHSRCSREIVHGLLAALVPAAACSAFEDWTPEEIFFEVTGSEGMGTRVVYSTEFSTGVGIDGVTSVLVYASDTVDHTLPIDTSMSIARDRRWLVLVEPTGGDTLDVGVFVSVDDRLLVMESGSIPPEVPWRYLYVFNQRITRDVDVRF